MTSRAKHMAMLLLGVSLMACQAATPAASSSDSKDSSAAASVSTTGESYLVRDQAEYADVLKKLTAGDTVVLANGTWNDFEILFTGKGEAGNPIRLTAETKGEVILSGQSNLRLAGEHLEVSGLVFKDGYTPTSEVIAFRRNADDFAYNSRVTEVVIDNYNNPERFEVDFWVMMYGKNNRFDHNHIVGKRNKGVTMAVRLNNDNSLENYHRIDHNYFGPRPILGSNGGETLRIGTSHHSRKDSFTTVENNYFDQADGELEIISNKSGKNAFLNNTFYKSRGTLTMRHGNNNRVEGNVFFGENADHTGGIRVINAGQTIRNNYMEGLKGTRFGGAFVVMNGVPNGPINRYDPVINAVMERNSLIDSDNIQLGAGSDPERSGVPKDSTFSHNLIYNSTPRDVFTVYDDMSGIDFKDNVIGTQSLPDFTDGFAYKAVSLSRAENGLMYPQDGIDAGAPRDLSVTQKSDTGVNWYPKADLFVAFGSGETVRVDNSPSALFEAVRDASAGDVITLAPGDYTVGKFLRLDKPLTLRGAGNVNITYERSALFELLDGGSLKLEGVTISGREAPDNAGNAVIRTSPYSMLKNYRLEIVDCQFVDMDVNHSFNVISTSKGTFADDITITNSSFSDATGGVLRLDREFEDYGIYNAEYLTITDSQFKNIGGALVDYYRGGTDESTFGPHFTLTGSRLENVGGNKRNASKASVHLHGVQVTNINDNDFIDSRPFVINHTVAEPKTRISNNRFKNTDDPIVTELNSGLPPTAILIGNTGIKNTNSK